VPLKPVAPLRLYQQVAEQLARLVTAGELPVGGRLPAERELAQSLGVSRPVVREAMIALELAGVVEVRMGSGAYVVQAPPPDFLTGGFARALANAGSGPLALVEAREAIEGETAARAALARSDDDLAALAAAIADMRARPGIEAHSDADRGFHVRIAEATGNEVLARIVDQLWREMFSPLFLRMGTTTGLFGVTRAETSHEHEAILAAIAVRDPAAARAAMHAHLATVRRVLTNPADEAEASREALPC
jgi:DNA-binding FadR family transcriptional regulator